MDKIKCPHCGKDVELTEAIIHQLSEQVRREEKLKLREQFDKEKAQEQAIREKKLREEFEEANKSKLIELAEIKKKGKELEEKLEKERLEREKAEEKIKVNARRVAEEEQKLKLKEKDLQLDEIRRVNEDLKRKLEQGSQQRQGEVLELDLEDNLKATFPNDEFVPVPKGVEGGDIWQKIKFNGKIVGSILWETKRTKAWANSWVIKLKEDAGRISASEAIIVSQVLPDGVSTFDRKDGVWVTNYELAINICRYVRYLITALHAAKSSISHSDEEWAKLREYMLSSDFKHRMSQHFESVKILKDQVDAEERAAKLRWRKQRTLYDKLTNNTYDFYLDLKNIVPNLPQIESLETNLLTSETLEDEEDNQTLF